MHLNNQITTVLVYVLVTQLSKYKCNRFVDVYTACTGMTHLFDEIWNLELVFLRSEFWLHFRVCVIDDGQKHVLFNAIYQVNW